MIRFKRKSKTIRNQLLWILSITSLVTMILVGGILSFILFRQSYEQAKEDLDFYIESVQNQLTNHMGFIEEVVVYIRNNQEMDDFFKNQGMNAFNFEKELERGANLFTESNIIKGLHPFVKDLYVFNLDYDSLETHFYPISEMESQAIKKRLKYMLKKYIDRNEGFYYYSYGEVTELYIALYDDNLRLKGYCVTLLSNSSLQEIFLQLEKYHSYYWQLSSNNNSSILGEIPKDMKIQDFKGTRGIAKVGSKNYIYNIKKGSLGMTSYIIIPKNKLYKDISPGFQLAWIISISSFIMVFAAIFYISNQLTQPFRTITQKMKQVGKGDFSTRLGSYEIEEFQEISDSFNEMTIKIDQLIKEVYEAELLTKEARIQYLQAQINPHFMFNVLSMIAIRLKMNKDEDLYKIVTAFAGLMQGKLFRKNEIEILLADEIEIAEFYLYLSGERFKDRVSYSIEWESEDLKECMIPRLCVEPIVENAMIHGLEPKADKGYIRLSIYQKDKEYLIIRVEDDGVGFDMNVVSGNEERKSPGVGIMNIQRLIYNLYGKKYGVEVESKIGEGTKVELKLPYSKEKLI